MTKTVFGMPGLGKQPSKEGEPNTRASTTSGGGSEGSPKKGAGAKPGTPAMAKPVNPPMARPTAGAAQSGAAAPNGGAKTVFGMPALKVPKKQPEAASTPNSPAQKPDVPKYTESAYGETQAISALHARGVSVPAAPPSGGDDKLAFTETVLGLAAVSPPDESPATTPSTVPKTAAMPATGASLGIDKTVAAGEQSSVARGAIPAAGSGPSGDASWSGDVADVREEPFTAGTTDGEIPTAEALSSSIYAAKKKSNKLVKIIVGVIGIIVLLAVAAIYILGGSGDIKPKVQPSLPPAYNPGGAQPQTAPTAPAGVPGAAAAPSAPAAPSSPAGIPAQ